VDTRGARAHPRSIDGSAWLEARGDEARNAPDFEGCAPVTRQRPRLTTQIRQLAGGFDDTPARNQIETSRGFLLESIAIEWVAIVNGVGSGEWVDAASRSTNSSADSTGHLVAIDEWDR
jgi:hypothetical protein